MKHNKSSRKRQLDLFNTKSVFASKKQMGGAKLTSNPKGKRPFSKKDELHVVLASHKAKGPLSMRRGKNAEWVRSKTYRVAEKTNVKISRFENVGNHLHLLIKAPSRSAYVKFIRGISAAISRLMTGAKKGRPQTKEFWDGRPFTRIVLWGRDRLGLLKYLNGNRIQAIGFQIFVREEELGYKLTG